MKKSSERKHKKSRIPKIAILGGIFLMIALLLYSVTGEQMITYYFEPEGEIELVSVTPENIDGVSCDTTVVLEWSHPVSVELIDAVKIYPSARGEWFISGNFLMFTPQQLAAGQYYTVTVPKGTVLNEQGDVLEESICFSFETEDPDLRIPESDAFDVDGRAFSFSNDESVMIPVVSSEEDTVDVSVYRADDADTYIDSLGKLFSYPSWAHLSINGYEGDLKGFDKVSETEMGIHWKNGINCVDLGSLPQGLYLVRLSSQKEQRDVAVTVSAVDVGVVMENGSLALWSHKNGNPNSGADISFGGESYVLDENGFVSMPCSMSEWSVYRDPSLLAVTVSDDDMDYIHFLSMDQLKTIYQSDLVLSKNNVLCGEDLLISGTVFSEYGKPVNGKVELKLNSSVEVVSSTEVDVENGIFSYLMEDIYLADGSYSFVLEYGDEKLSTENFTVGNDPYELVLTVEKSDDTVKDGDTVTFDISLCDLRGKAVTDALITVTGGSEVAVDENGNAVVRKTFHAADGLSSVQQDTVFGVISPYGTAESVVSSVSVVSGRKPMNNENQTVSSAEKDVLPLLYGESGFVLPGEEELPNLNMAYNDGEYTVAIPASAPVWSDPERIHTTYGETIVADADLGGVGYRTALVTLCEGRVPDGLCDTVITGESFNEHTFGTVLENRVFFEGEPISAAFSSENRNGDYYIRIAVKTADNNVYVRYIPVSVEGVVITCPDDQSLASSYHTILPFMLNTDKKFDYKISVGDDVFTGKTKEHFVVSLGSLGTGQYNGEIVILDGENVVASKTFDFEVYQSTPMFTEVVEGKGENALYSFLVKKGTEDAFRSAYDIMELPGDQILQRMGRTLFYDAFGENVDYDLSDMDYDLSAFQNGDGSFGRYAGADGDLLLSVFVAEQEIFVCDRDSLCAYLKYRLVTADNPETAALACWGLSCFGVDCSDSMSLVYESKGKTDRTLLYLAEGYEAAGNRSHAEEIYEELSDELIESDGTLHMPESDDQYNIANTVFMLDLSLKLERPESDGLMGFLIHSDIQIQSGRYLLLSGIARNLDPDDICTMNSNVDQSDYSVLSVVSSDLGEVPTLSTSFSMNGESVDEINQGDVAELSLYWEASPNSIYLVYVNESGSSSVIEKDGLTKRKGYCEYVTNLGSATISFVAGSYGDNVTPTVYIIDLTTGKIVGRSDNNGLKVNK